MASREIKIPSMGEGITEATIIKWLRLENQTINEDETLVEIATDKVDSEITAPVTGKIIKIFSAEGNVAKVGDTIAIISDEENDSVTEDINPQKVQIEKNVLQTKHLEKMKTVSADIQTQVKYAGHRFLSPLIRNIVTEENIGPSEIENIKGTGLEGRITKNDMLNFIANRDVQPETKEIPVTNITDTAHIEKIHSVNPVSVEADSEVIPMDRVRKLIADHMINSIKTSAHVTSFIEADATSLVIWRENVKNEFQNRYNEKLSLTPLLLEAVINTLKDFPMINASVDGTNIIKKNYINLGMATAQDNGNLIVPVIKNACQKNLIGLTKSVNDLASRARVNKLNPDEITGGTFTVTNLGTFGSLAGTPIINQPELAILGLGAIKKRPVVIESKNGDTIGIRHIIILSLSFDHRVIDGVLGGKFLQLLAANISNFNIDRKL